MVKPKKHLGQHFLTEDSIAKRIVDSMDFSIANSVVEIGPGTGVLTQFLANNDLDLFLCEVDTESIDYLNEHYPQLEGRVLNQDFLHYKLNEHYKSVNVIGNFPYNISSQILFRVYDYVDVVPQVVGMFQKEVAQRVAEKPGSKVYGILSVLLQAYYDIEYLFSVKPGSFNPPPKVESGVIRLTRNSRRELPCNKKLFTRVVKAAFNQRRKTLRNAVKPILEGHSSESLPYMGQRAEQLSVDQFLELTVAIEAL